MKGCSLCFLLALSSIISKAQTNISGVINTYTPVMNVSNGCSCPTTDCASVTVLSAAGFSVGDTVLLIQMKGALADTSNTSAHGSILNLYDAGNYEFATISSIASNVITTADPLTGSYFTGASPADSACVQLIRVPHYAGNVNVTETLTAQAWNGRTGGVLAFYVDGTLTIQGNISVEGKGFKAAKRQQATLSCSFDTAFYYQSTHFQYSTCSSCGYVYGDSPTRWSQSAKYGGCCGGNGCLCNTNRMMTTDRQMGSFRGEGIVANTFRKRNLQVNSYGETEAIFDKGKGRWGNGGGGGGNHNAGGGGGGNYGTGGFGGNTYNVVGSSGCNAAIITKQRGYGGASLTPTSSKVFMGGGGGEGHDNGLNGSTGTAGGGIIFISAASIANSGSYTISANGVDNTVIAAGDGSGGGGAGGSILLNVPGGYTNSITISAHGGKGGDHNNNTCHGTGGGGGGGVIWFSQGSQPANVTSDISAGVNGIQIAPTFDCDPDTSWGATPGTDGAEIYEGSSPFFNFNTCGSLLPVKWVSFAARPMDRAVYLEWVTGSESDNQFFTLERSRDGKTYQALTSIPGAGTSNEQLSYSYVDEHPISGSNYYRLRQTDYNGYSDYSRVVKADINIPQAKWTLSPNPASSFLEISTYVPSNESGTLSVFDMFGKQVLAKPVNLSDGQNLTSLDVSGLNSGCYFILLVGSNTRLHGQFVKY